MVFQRKIKTGNGTYLAEVKNTWQNGKVVQKHLRTIGKLTKDGIVYSKMERLKAQKVYLHGNILALHKIAKEIGLDDVFGSYATELLSLCYAHCIEPRSINSMYKFLRKVNTQRLFGETPTTKTLRMALESVDEEFIANAELEIFERMRKLYPYDDAVIYDVTRIYFHGMRCKLAKPGYNPDMVFIPQINIGLVVTRKHGFPIFHKVFPGNTYDSKTLFGVVTELKRLKVKGCLLICDRGAHSTQNIGHVIDGKLKLITGIPLKGNLKRLVTANKEKMSKPQNRVGLKTTSIYALTVPYKLFGKKRKLVICLNEEMRVSIREARRRRIDETIKLIEEGKPVKNGVKKYLITSGDDIEIDYDALEKAEEFDGFYVLLSTEKDMNKNEIVRLYFEKDIIEKAFKCLKSVVEVAPIRKRVCSNVYAHIFVCYLAYALLSVLEYKLEGVVTRKGRKLTASAALDALETVYEVMLEDPVKKQSISKIVTLSEQQEEILKALEINIPSVKSGQT